MRYLRIMLIPERGSTKTLRVPQALLKATAILLIATTGLLVYLVKQYANLADLEQKYSQITTENAGLRGEAQLLISNLDDVKRSLHKVESYSNKLRDLTNIQLTNVKKKTGIGPLSPMEMSIAIEQDSVKAETAYIPLGIDLDKLMFKTAFDSLSSTKYIADDNALKLQRLLSNLSQKKSLLSSIPSIPPVNGWITSGYGPRISPFTGEKTMHSGVDVASPIGTPIYAPADGVVIFSGAKAGFGNFIMIAHGNGVVSRYGHNAQNMVQPGQKVSRGEQIGTVGMTGRTTGPHLHYEVVVNGIHIDPKKFMLTL